MRAIAESRVATRPLALLRFRINGWRVASSVVALVVATPLVFVFLSILGPSGEIMEHLSRTLLAELLFNTFTLVLGVSISTLVLGAGLAWLTAIYDYPGRGFFSWALMLPLAVPAYVMAFVFIGIFDFMGPVQTLLRDAFGPGKVVFPDINSRGGVILTMSLVLYPYVYLLSRNAFMTQGRRLQEASRLMGHGTLSSFFMVMLPMARPWIASGLLLVVMETLADFGTVSIFNYNTFTTAIYKAWFGFFSIESAAQLSSILVVLAFVVLVLEQRSRGGMRYHRTGRDAAGTPLVKLQGLRGWGAFAISGGVFLFAFAVPAAQLVLWAVRVRGEEFGTRYVSYFIHTVSLGLISAAVVCVTALVLAYAKRVSDDPVTRFLNRVSTLGYALPGTILAVGIFIPVAILDNHIIDALALDTSSVLKGTVSVLVIAYAIRFMAAGYGAVDSALNRISRSLDEASNLLGRSGIKMLGKVHVPLLKGGITTAAIMVLVDVMKEMPITLMMRPFGWDTLAVKIFELTSEGEWERASISALALVAAGLLPVVILAGKGDKD